MKHHRSFNEKTKPGLIVQESINELFTTEFYASNRGSPYAAWGNTVVFLLSQIKSSDFREIGNLEDVIHKMLGLLLVRWSSSSFKALTGFFTYERK